MLKRNLIGFLTLAMIVFGTYSIRAQFPIKVPKIPKIDKPKAEATPMPEEAGTTTRSRQNDESKAQGTGSKFVYQNQLPTNKPVLMKSSIYIQSKVHDEYWKFPNQQGYSSWVPLIRFSQFYNNAESLKYKVEYFSPDGSAWYSEILEQGTQTAERTVVFQSPSPYSGILDQKSTNLTGLFSFKITDQSSNEILFKGKFKINKFSRSTRPQEKNKFDFYVEHDWLIPFGIIGFHHSNIELGGMRPEVSMWLNGDVDASQLEGTIFHKGQKIATTGERGRGISSVEERFSNYAPGFARPTIWKRWQFVWDDFRLDNNASFNHSYYPNALYVDKNPGDYTVKVFRNGTQIREMDFAVGNDGRFVVPTYSNEIPLPYYRIVLPVKVIGAVEKANLNAWKTDAFYSNPISSFAVQ